MSSRDKSAQPTELPQSAELTSFSRDAPASQVNPYSPAQEVEGDDPQPQHRSPNARICVRYADCDQCCLCCGTVFGHGNGHRNDEPDGRTVGSISTHRSWTSILSTHFMIFASLLTGSSRAAVATIAVRGQAATHVVLAAFQTAGPGKIQVGQVRYGVWHGGDQVGVGESVVVSRNDDCQIDHVVTESWEIHCHGGAVAANRMLDDLQRLGAVVVDSAQWVNKSCSLETNDTAPLTMDQQNLWIVEAVEVLSNAVSVRTAAIALDQVRGAMLGFVCETLRRLCDSPGEHAAVTAEIAGQAAQMLRFASLGVHLAKPWRVVLAGPPNVGKSSLINALVGYHRSIIVDQPGTTRDVLEAQTVIDGWPVRLSDTAGIRDDAECAIESAGIESARRELEDADLILWVEDASVSSDSNGEQAERLRHKPIIHVSNKIDRVSDLANFGVNEGSTMLPRVRTSATLGTGIEELRQAISSALVPEVPIAGSPVPITSRQLAWLRRLSEATGADRESGIKNAKHPSGRSGF